MAASGGGSGYAHEQGSLPSDGVARLQQDWEGGFPSPPHAPPSEGGQQDAMPEDPEVLREVFDLFDTEHAGEVPTASLDQMLERLGRDPRQAEVMLQEEDPEQKGRITFEQFVSLLQSYDERFREEEPDPKVLEFLRILEEYRVKCEQEGNYMEAERALKQHTTLRKRESKRVMNAVKARHQQERADVQAAHEAQFNDFNAAWDQYLEEYDQKAQMYVRQMTENHQEQLREFQEKLNEDMRKRPPKYSRELLDWRRREQMLARQKKYAEAQKVKHIADELEERERTKSDEGRLSVYRQREAKFRHQQQNELSALLKRIERRRHEHQQQREADTKRLLLRNKNVQTVLENKQSSELSKKKSAVQSQLAPHRVPRGTIEPIDTGMSTNRLAKARRERQRADDTASSHGPRESPSRTGSRFSPSTRGGRDTDGRVSARLGSSRGGGRDNGEWGESSVADAASQRRPHRSGGGLREAT